MYLLVLELVQILTRSLIKRIKIMHDPSKRPIVGMSGAWHERLRSLVTLSSRLEHCLTVRKYILIKSEKSYNSSFPKRSHGQRCAFAMQTDNIPL